MENRKFIKSIPILILGFFILQTNAVLAYSVETHAYLTSEAIKFYNQNFSNNRIQEELRDYLIDGSRREDDKPRWMNHFYDPVYNRGLTSKIFGDWQKSKDWAQDSNNQNSLTYKVPAIIASILTAIQQVKISALTTETDFTWQRAIKFYIQGEKEKAMFTLGHILHLLQDKAVPDHTRNDPHPGDSYYEKYAKQFNFSDQNINLSNKIIPKKVIILNNLNLYFNELANISNNNYYSNDTIGIQSGYVLPTPDDYETINNILFARKKDGDGFYMLSAQPVQSSVLMGIKGEITIDNNRVLFDYWSRLSTKSIQYGAGLINLFFQEVEKAKSDPNFVKEQKSFLSQAVDSTKNLLAQISNFFFDSNETNQKQSSEAQSPLAENNSFALQSLMSNTNSLILGVSDPEEEMTTDANNSLLTLAETQAQLNLIQSQLNQISQQVQMLSSSQPQNQISPMPFNTGIIGGTNARSEPEQAEKAAPNNNQSAPNQPPIAQFVFSSTNYYAGESIAFNAASSSDPDGQIILYQWNFGNNQTFSVSQPATTHSYAVAGEYLIELTVFDEQNASAVASSTISILPDPRPSRIENFTVQYDPVTVQLIFNWNESQDANGATSTIVYEIQEYSSPGAVIFRQAGATSFGKRIDEIGRDYHFSIQAFDENDLSSAMVTSTIFVPSFLSGIDFCPDPQNSNEYLIKLHYDQYPFLPNLYGWPMLAWKQIFFYLNGDSNKTVNLQYGICVGGNVTTNSLLLPDATQTCGNAGGAYSYAFRYENIGQNHLVVKALASDEGFGEDDYLTVTFWSTVATQRFDGRVPFFGFVAIDKIKYRFITE